MADDAERRGEEMEALQAVYGDDAQVAPASGIDAFCWSIRLDQRIVLELRLPNDYPSTQPPIPKIKAPEWILDERMAADLAEELLEMWTEDTEVAILWAEHCRSALVDIIDDGQASESASRPQSTSAEATATRVPDQAFKEQKEGTRVFHPYTAAKYGQAIRQFDESVISNPDNRREIHRGQPYHPPKSGPSETLKAFVASVESMDHVQFVLAELLFGDKKVAKATHNMFAYRFWDTREGKQICLVSDNDDDGEKGSGAKLAALLELSDAKNVIVVVSRWYGGVKLGPARFKHFASTARDALVEAGFIKAVGTKSKR